ncbi:Pycsar system effector family protein [Mesorhizobium calcicola]|uniref:Pycsar system effector family protein n=1 Tax=Mesorhizobium calcicola TaxID=1300310 RepID=A0ABW4WB22_9HYPH
MAKNDQQESYEKALAANHSRMMDLVKFAEAKNAALLTFCSVWMATIIGILRSTDEPPMGYRTAFLVALPLLAVAAVVTLTSFLPKLLHHLRHEREETSNLLYFGHIASLEIDDFGPASKQRYYPVEGQSFSDEYLDDLAVQVAVQARIANRKFKTFNAAGRLVLASFVCMAAPPVVWAVQVVWEAGQNWVSALH